MNILYLIVLYSVQCTSVYSVQCTVYVSLQCTVYVSVQCTVYSVQCTVYVSVQCTVYVSVQCTSVYSVHYCMVPTIYLNCISRHFWYCTVLQAKDVHFTTKTYVLILYA